MSADSLPMEKTLSTVQSGDVTERRGSVQDANLQLLGYEAQLRRNRSMYYLLFQTLAIAAIPFGEGGPLIVAIYGGGPLSIFLGWILACLFAQCIALSLSELASRYPTSAGPYYWAFQLSSANKTTATLLSFFTGWTWLIGNWTITLSVNFGFASMLGGAISLYHPDFILTPWQLVLIFYAICIIAFVVCAFGNKVLPYVDTACAAFTALAILIILITLSTTAKAGRHTASYALGHYDDSFSGWGNFTFFIGLLPAAYTFSAIGMISSMAEETAKPTTQVPTAISLCVPVGAIAGLLFILPICFTLPPMEDIIAAPYGQALPYIFGVVTGTPGGGLGLTFLVLAIILFCSISITTAASRCTWAFARDNAIPGSKLWSKLHNDTPILALALTTVVQMLLGLINIGSVYAFTAFVSVGVVALAVSYAVPITVSMLNGRREVNRATWKCPNSIGWVVNIVAVLWIAFELVLFSMPTVLPVTDPAYMNYASVVLVGFMTIAVVWYFVAARKVYVGPPESDGIPA